MAGRNYDPNSIWSPDELEKQNQKQIFNGLLTTCLKDYPQTRSRPWPVFVAQGQYVDLHELSSRVQDMGGYDIVTANHMWPAISEALGLGPSCGPTLKLIYAKYLKLAERWMKRLSKKRNYNGLTLNQPNTQIVTYSQPGLPSSPSMVNHVHDMQAVPSGSRRRNDVLLGMLDWIKSVARNPGDSLRGHGLRGSCYSQRWVQECVNRAGRVRDILFHRVQVSSPRGVQYAQKKQKVHPTLYEEPTKVGNQVFERKRTSQQHIAVYGFQKQPVCASSCVASFLPGVHTVCSMVSSSPTVLDIRQHPQTQVSSFCNITASYGYTFKEHIPRKRVRLGPEFQADVPDWNGPMKQSQKQTENADSCFDDDLDDTRWILDRVWPMKDCEGVVNEERIGKGRPDGCFCGVQGSIECVRLHIEEEREKLKAELGIAFSSWRFDNMGEVVSKSWTLEDERKFSALVRLNPASLDKNFWNHLPTCFPSKSIEDLVSYYFNVFVLRRRGFQNRAMPYQIDSDDDESEVGCAQNSNRELMKRLGTKNKVSMLKGNHLGSKSSSLACCVKAQDYGVERFQRGGECTLSLPRLPHLEDHSCVGTQKQHGVASLSYNMEYLRMLPEKAYHGAITVEKL